MKFLPYLAALLLIAICACNSDEQSTWDEYTDWREANNAWLKDLQQKRNADGSPYYTTIIPDWNPGAFVLIHYFNDRSETEGNLSPMYTSTIDVRYKLHLYDNTPVDSSDLITDYGKLGVYQAQLSRQITGWGIALPHMRCGDTAEIIVPYGVAYGDQQTGIIKPYSNLRFNVRLENIAHYETAP